MEEETRKHTQFGGTKTTESRRFSTPFTTTKADILTDAELETRRRVCHFCGSSLTLLRMKKRCMKRHLKLKKRVMK